MPFRSVSKATIAFGEEFLYEFKAGPAGGGCRHPHTMCMSWPFSKS
jgi:hypothetical protein